MKSSKYNDLEVNRETMPLASFMESYNKSAPESLPRASVETLKQFHESNPSLFKSKNSWSIDKHRKRFMDWLSSHQNNA
ncbi:MAG: hypothetical protein ACE5HI_17245 [bacterium]